MNKTIRNIIIFAVVTVGGGFLGYAINTQYQPQDPMQSLGVLIWLASPLAANLLLRALGGDGWKDFGIRLNLRSGWRWYLAALLIVPAITLVTLGSSLLFGSATISGFDAKGMGAFLALLGAGFAGNMVKNIFEEFSWRGYLTPRLETLKLSPVIRSIITGVIWSCWHIPYYLYFLDRAAIQAQTSLSVPAIILFSLFLLPFQAFAYAELRLLTRSVWPGWLLHNIANSVSFALVTGGYVILAKNFASILLTPSTEGILYALLMGLIGWGLYKRRMLASKGAR
ncbi:MAG: CPBP family intramembrane metalloprotease [Anaerolineaceae bacterium]|nr:CPBP family intramembrane metalloprotease [Anaerolineaceae bacterium]